MPQPNTQAAFEQYLQHDIAQRHIALFEGCWLQSVFQPIHYRSGGLFGYEALLRVHDAAGQAIRPDHFLASLPVARQIDADRLARVLHTRNFAASGEPGCLSLNLLPASLLHAHDDAGNDAAMLQRLAELGIGHGRVILEVVEYEVEEGGQALSQALHSAAQAGFGIAVDDFGAMVSAHGRVHALRPDILKIDRSLLLDYMQGDGGRLQRVLEQGWQIGCRMLIEGVETAEQLAAMQALGLELYQGFYLGMPAKLGVVPPL